MNEKWLTMKKILSDIDMTMYNIGKQGEDKLTKLATCKKHDNKPV